MIRVPCAEKAQPQSIGNDKDGAETHCKSTDHRTEFKSECRVEDSCSNRNSDNVVDECPKKIFFDVFDGRLAEPDSGRNFSELSFH